jgi:hypothetical protein
MPSIAETIAKLMTDAHMRITHPAAHLLLVADQVTSVGSDEPLPPGARRKMHVHEAHAVLETVTRRMRCHGLNASTVCREAKVANEPKGFYKFNLTADEMDGAGNLTAPLKPKRRAYLGIGPYIRMMRVMASETGLAEADLLQELAEVIPDFLAPFAGSDRDLWETLFDDLALLGPYFARVRQGSDGQPIQLRRFFADAAREGVAYSLLQDRMVTELENSSRSGSEEFWHAPSVPLFARVVASGTAECKIFEEGMDGEPFSIPLGEVEFKVVEVVHMAIVQNGNALRTALFVEPWTALPDTPSGFVRGTPFWTYLQVPDDKEPYYIDSIGETIRFLCPVYENYVSHHLAEMGSARNNPIKWRDCLKALNSAQRIEIDPETLRSLLERQSDKGWRSLLGSMRSPAEVADSLALPASVLLTGDQISEALVDRLKEALLGDEQTLLARLTEQVTRRVRAMDRFMAEFVNSERSRRQRYRRLMRS